MFKYIVIAVAAAVMGGTAVYFMLSRRDVDLLSQDKREVVVLGAELPLRNSEGAALTLPAGTVLTLNAQYVDEATLSLTIVTTRLHELLPAEHSEQTYYGD